MPAQPPTNPPPGPYGPRPQPPHYGNIPQQPASFPAPPPPPLPPPKKSNTGLIIGLVGGGLVLVFAFLGMVGLGIFGFVALKSEPTAEPSPGDSSPTSRPAPLPYSSDKPNSPPPPNADVKSNLGQLRAGDCIVDLSNGTAPTTVPCSDPHVHQIYSVGRTPSQSGTYPGLETLKRDGSTYCKTARFELDSDRANADGLKVVYFTPNATAWQDPENRRIICAVQRPDGSDMTEDYSQTA